MGSGTYQITFSAIVYELIFIVVQPCTPVTLHYKAKKKKKESQSPAKTNCQQITLFTVY